MLWFFTQIFGVKIQILEDDVIRRDVRARLLVPNDDESSRGALLRTKKARQLSCCLGEASEAASLCKQQLNQTERNGRRSAGGCHRSLSHSLDQKPKVSSIYYCVKSRLLMNVVVAKEVKAVDSFDIFSPSFQMVRC